MLIPSAAATAATSHGDRKTTIAARKWRSPRYYWSLNALLLCSLRKIRLVEPRRLFLSPPNTWAHHSMVISPFLVMIFPHQRMSWARVSLLHCNRLAFHPLFCTCRWAGDETISHTDSDRDVNSSSVDHQSNIQPREHSVGTIQSIDFFVITTKSK